MFRRDRFGPEYWRDQMGQGSGNPMFGRLTPKAALVIFGGLIVVLFLIAVLGGGSAFRNPGYFDDAKDLSAEARADLDVLAPASVIAACLDGNAAACAQQQTNAGAAAERVDALYVDFLELSVPSEAVEWNATYIAALIDLREALEAQEEALDDRDPAAFAAAVAETRSAADAEVALTEQFNRDFPEEPLQSNPSTPAP